MALGLGTVFLAGLATLLTPCVLPMIPVYLSMFLGEGLETAKAGRNRYRLIVATVWFVIGFGLIFVALGFVASAAGTALAAHRSSLVVLSGGAIAALGAKQLGLIRIPWLDRTLQPYSGRASRGWMNGLLYGVAFAIGWTPCVGPILGSVLTYTAASTGDPWRGALLLSAYTAGLGVPLLAIALAADRVLPTVRRLHRFLPKLEKTVGVVMVGVGLYLAIPTAWSAISATTGRGEQQTLAAQAAPLGKPSAEARLIEFYTEDCPVCERMAPLVDQLRAECEHQGLEILQVDASDPAQGAAAARFRVSAVPSFHLLDSNGAEAARVVGEQSLPQLRALAAKVVEGGSCVGDAAADEVPAPANGRGCAVDNSATFSQGPGSSLGEHAALCAEDS